MMGDLVPVDVLGGAVRAAGILELEPTDMPWGERLLRVRDPNGPLAKRKALASRLLRICCSLCSSVVMVAGRSSATSTTNSRFCWSATGRNDCSTLSARVDSGTSCG